MRYLLATIISLKSTPNRIKHMNAIFKELKSKEESIVGTRKFRIRGDLMEAHQYHDAR